MPVQRIDLKFQHPKDQWKNLLGKLLTESDVDEIVDHDADIYTPEGDLLCKFRKGAIPFGPAAAAHSELRKLNQRAKNRGMATGKGLARKRIRADGSKSKTNVIPEGLAPISNIIGYFDRQERQPFITFPYCRQTMFTARQPEAWARCLPFIQGVSEVYRREAPERWALQKEVVDRTSPDFVIPQSVYTTITVNKNWQTAVHSDKGDLKAGLSCITALCAGSFEGGYLVFPHYRVGVNLRTCDLLMFDSHHMHGNTPMRGKINQWERVSLVLYYREKMLECGSAAQELEYAKRNKRSNALLSQD